MKELYNYYNAEVYTKRPRCGIAGESDVFKAFTVTDSKPFRGKTTLNTFEYRDFRFVETYKSRAGVVGVATYIPTGEVIVENTSLWSVAQFVYWYYNCRG